MVTFNEEELFYMTVKYRYEFIPDCDEWRKSEKEYITSNEEDIKRIEEIFAQEVNSAGDRYRLISKEIIKEDN